MPPKTNFGHMDGLNLPKLSWAAFAGYSRMAWTTLPALLPHPQTHRSD
jgi:hypothetical protein